ncbi:hypothetical protein WKK05_10535 [Nostoc sp. UHCC 0302]|uniref:hypothetical protein n=1 Tax=Nostoc sp. UHCC 0302 TaxID=3134896 RepID=UPI00311CA207
MTTSNQTPLLRLAGKCLKYFLLVLFGFAIAYALSSALGIFHVLPILGYILQLFLFPMGVILLCLITTAVILESLR